MSQQFQVLCCFSCDILQVHQVKKSSKWQCKLCGAKQSIRMVFVVGTGADCRKFVQNGNLLNGQKREQVLTAGNEESCHAESHLPTSSNTANSKLENSESRWMAFLEDSKTIDGESYQSDHQEMSSAHPESVTSLKRKSNDDYRANLNARNIKKSNATKSLSGEDAIYGGNWVYEKPNSSKTDVESAPVNAHEVPTTFMHNSNESHERNKVIQNNEQEISSSSKWFKYIENS